MTDDDSPSTLWELFRAAADRHPDRLAVDVPPSRSGRPRVQLTYRDLITAAGQFAAALDSATRLDAGDEALIGLMLPRAGPDLLAAQLAAGLLGRPWTYLDPRQPDARLRHLVADGPCRQILSTSDQLDRAKSLGAERIVVAEEVEGGARVPAARAGPGSAAYVIYTSGTTGQPKGVVIEEAAIVNLVLSDLETFDLAPEDRVAQGSSAAYDSYLEEVWLALAVGGTVVVLDDEAIRLGPDLPDFLRRERITVLCPPPTLLRTMSCAEPRRELPDLRLLYVGGEALPADVAASWAPGRRLENGYGPTECTVTVMRATISAEGPITIGHPIRGHRALVVDGSLAEVPTGEVGELCIAGPGLARAYLGQPELTAEKFPSLPGVGRVYRTGDLVRVDGEGRHHYLGRADSQVKIRGHRIELEEVEAQLAAQSGVREAACRVEGAGLSAWVVAEGEFDLDDLRGRIEQILPEAMRPSFYGRLSELPRSTGGKLDRAALPAADADDQKGELSTDAAVARVQEAFRAALELDGPPRPDADFFIDLGGHSLAAAIAVSRLRSESMGAAVTVRSLYESPTAEDLAERMRDEGAPRAVESAERDHSGIRSTTAIQSLAIVIGSITLSALFSLLIFHLLPDLLTASAPLVSAMRIILVFFLIELVLIVASVTTTVAVKRVLIGRYRPGRWPAWGSFHLRHWLVSGCAATIPFGLLRGSGLDLVVLRMLGARVGRRVWIDRGVDLLGGGWDLLEIGDDAVLGRDCEIRSIVLEDGALVLDRVRVGARAVLESRAGLSPGSDLGDGARLGALSLADRGQRIDDRSRAEGIPALATGAPVQEPAPETAPAIQGFSVLLLAARQLASIILAAPALLYATSLALVFGLDDRSSGHRIDAFVGSGLAIFGLALGLATLLLIDLGLRAFLCRLLGPIRPGRQGRNSWAFIRHELSVGLLEGAGRTLSGTMFWPAWLRAAGMRIGRGCEISSIMETAPDLLTIGPGSFFADGIYLGGPRHEPGWVEFRPTTIGASVFLGNHAVIPGGTGLADDILLGIATPAPSRALSAGSAWFGHPAFELPRRERLEVDRELTHDPSPFRWMTRFFWEALRFFVPLPPVLIGLVALGLLLDAQSEWQPLTAHLLAATLLFWAASTLLALSVLALKWLLLGRTRPGTHPLWSCWCSRWDFLYVVWQAWAGPVLRAFEGTLLLSIWLRAMGVRIGRRVLLSGGFTQVVDPDMLVIEDEATVDGLFQAHSFEDRVLKTEPLFLRARSSSGFGSVMLYGAELAPGARLAPHSVAMKHEQLSAFTEHIGCPTRARTIREP